MKNFANRAGLFPFFLLPLTAYAGCHVTATGMNFGVYDIFDPVTRSSTTTLTVWCDPGLHSDVAIGIGPSANSGVIVPRQMRLLSGTDRLHYNLFIDASLTTAWGDGTTGATVELPRVAPNKNIPLTIYGAIFAGQDVSAGSYSDSVAVTITP